VLEQEQIALRLFDTAAAAEHHHRQGLIRLLQLQLKEQMKQLENLLGLIELLKKCQIPFLLKT
jgi:ATP-dependent helicase HrpA